MQYFGVTIPPAVRPTLSRQIGYGIFNMRTKLGSFRTHERRSHTNKSAQELTRGGKKDCRSSTPAKGIEPRVFTAQATEQHRPPLALPAVFPWFVILWTALFTAVPAAFGLDLFHLCFAALAYGGRGRLAGARWPLLRFAGRLGIHRGFLLINWLL